jgi:hypothetical protein
VELPALSVRFKISPRNERALAMSEGDRRSENDMKNSFSLVANRFRYIAAVALTFPFVTGAEGDGCRPGGDVPVGSNDGGVCSFEICRDLPRELDARICADGTTLERSVCLPGIGGRCGWEFPECPADGDAGQIDAQPPACGPDACRGLPVPDDAKVCPDGTTQSRTVCATAANGKCYWSFPRCPRLGDGAACVQEDCAGKPARSDAKICADGTLIGRTLCAVDQRGECEWDFPDCP